jgi:hypothetical protein
MVSTTPTITIEKYTILFGEDRYSESYFGDAIRQIKYSPKSNTMTISVRADYKGYLYKPVEKIWEVCQEHDIPPPKLVFKLEQ